MRVGQGIKEHGGRAGGKGTWGRGVRGHGVGHMG